MSELADLWVRHAAAMGWSVESAAAVGTAIRQFVEFVEASAVADVSIAGPGDDVGLALMNWRRESRERGKSEKHWNAVLTLVRRAGFEGVPLQPTLAILATRPTHEVRSVHRNSPLEEFTNAERILQTKTATDDLVLVEKRLHRGVELYEQRRDLRRLIEFARTSDSFNDVHRALRAESAVVTEIESITGVDVSAKSISARVAVKTLGSLISPTPLEILSFQILLQWATGVAPEQVRLAALEGLSLDESGVSWASLKARSSKLIRMRFEGVEPWRVAGLFSRAIHATALVRRLTNLDRVMLSFSVVAPRETPGVLQFKAMPHPRPSFRDWLESHEIVVSPPFDLRRIRKTATAVRAGVAPTAELAAQPDHTLQTFSGSYAGTSTTMTRSGRVIVRAQERVLARAARGEARVIPAIAAQISAFEDGTVSELAIQTSNRSGPERSLTASACRDPQDSPYEVAGEWCTKAPFACMLCPNAVIFSDHVPQLILMKNSLEAQAPSLSPDDYAQNSFPVVQAIDSYLQQFDEETRRGAEAAISCGTETLSVPLVRKPAQ